MSLKYPIRDAISLSSNTDKTFLLLQYGHTCFNHFEARYANTSMTSEPEQQQAPGAGVLPGLQGIKHVTPMHSWNMKEVLLKSIFLPLTTK